MLPERIDNLVGSMLGKDYRVLQPIGAGGMAVVYLVEHQTLLKQFAAKVLSSELASSLEARARFAQEAHAASQLDHENIVSISDFGVTADQRPFFVMELLRGQTLDQRLAKGPMTIEEVVAVSVPVARALAHAHAEGIVHRDVKPENIFLVQRSQGRWGVKVVDFGIAKTPVNPKLTQTKPKVGETMGSPLFMAPEMIRGEDDVDARADVYSFGIVLYLMLCGRLPFYDENLLKVMQMHLSVPAPPPRTIRPELAAELAAVVERALAKRPEDRYPTMAVLLRDLEAALPAGSDRLLIEAQSGVTRGETPFAATLSVSRRDAQRTMRITPLRAPNGPVERAAPHSSSSGPALRTMRVTPLRAPVADPRGGALRALTPRRLAIVVSSALVTGLCGAIAWTKITEHRARPAAPAAAVPVSGGEVSAPPQPTEPAPQDPVAASGDEAAPAAVDRQPAAEPGSSVARSSAAPLSPADASLKAEPQITSSKRPAVRAKPPIRRELRPGKRVALATSPPSGVPAAGDGTGSAPSTPSIETVPAAVQSAAPTAGEHDAGAAPEPPRLPPVAKPVPVPVPPPPPPPPPRPSSLDAVPEIATLDVKGPLLASTVRRSMDRLMPSLRSCYRAAARASVATPAIDLRITFEIDENSMATHVSTSGANFGSLASCAASKIGQLRTQEAPDVGTAQVSVLIRFRPS